MTLNNIIYHQFRFKEISFRNDWTEVEPFWAIFEPFWAILSHFEPFWAILSPGTDGVWRNVLGSALCAGSMTGSCQQHKESSNARTPQNLQGFSKQSESALELLFKHGLTPALCAKIKGMSPFFLVKCMFDCLTPQHSNMISYDFHPKLRIACPHDLRWTRLLQPGGGMQWVMGYTVGPWYVWVQKPSQSFGLRMAGGKSHKSGGKSHKSGGKSHQYETESSDRNITAKLENPLNIHIQKRTSSSALCRVTVCHSPCPWSMHVHATMPRND